MILFYINSIKKNFILKNIKNKQDNYQLNKTDFLICFLLLKKKTKKNKIKLKNPIKKKKYMNH